MLESPVLEQTEIDRKVIADKYLSFCTRISKIYQTTGKWKYIFSLGSISVRWEFYIGQLSMLPGISSWPDHLFDGKGFDGGALAQLGGKQRTDTQNKHSWILSWGLVVKGTPYATFYLWIEGFLIQELLPYNIYIYRSRFIRIIFSEDLEKSLKSKCLTRTYEKISHTTWTLNIKIWVICLYRFYNNFKVHVLFFMSSG